VKNDGGRADGLADVGIGGGLDGNGLADVGIGGGLVDVGIGG